MVVYVGLGRDYIIHFGKTNPKYWRYFKVLTIQTFRIFVAPSNFSALPIKPYFDNADFHIGSMGIFELVSRRSIDPTGWRGVHRRERNVCRVTPGHASGSTFYGATGGDPQGLPDLVLAPQRNFDSIGARCCEDDHNSYPSGFYAAGLVRYSRQPLIAPPKRLIKYVRLIVPFS